MVDSKLVAIAEHALDECCRAFPLGYRPRIAWKSYRVTAGMAYYRQGVIGLSSRVLKDSESVRDTLVHEYAHLLAVHRHGRMAAGHGEPWKRAMQDLGQPPRVRHNYSVERNVSRQRVIYLCLRCQTTIERPRRLTRGRRYLHATCGGDLRLIKVERVTDSQ